MVRPSFPLGSLFLAIGCFGAQFAPAEMILPIEQQRYVDASATVLIGVSIDDSEYFEAPGFDLFVADADASVSGEGNSASAGTHQTSDIGDPFVSLDATASFLTSAAGGTVSAHSDSSFDLTFELSAETPYILGGSISATHGASAGGSMANILLTGPGGVDVINEQREDGELLFFFEGVLSPGEYHLAAAAQSFADELEQESGSGFAEVSFGFFVPEPSFAIALGLCALVMMRNTRTSSYECSRDTSR